MSAARRRRLLAGLVVLLALGAWWSYELVFPEEQKTARGMFRDAVLEQFPELAERARSEYGLRILVEGEWEPIDGAVAERMVVLIHGLDEPGLVWRNLSPELARRGFSVAQMYYPNDQPVSRSAALFAAELTELSKLGAAEIAIAGHSMGGLVSREMLTSPAIGYARWQREGALPAVRALIMVGTPNQGSVMARFRIVTEVRDQALLLLEGKGHLLGGILDGAGAAKIDLLPDSRFLRELNARPLPEGVAMTVIAGRASPLSAGEIGALADDWGAAVTGNADGLEEFGEALGLIVEGIGDGAVSIASTRIEGVDDHVIVDGNHLTMIRNVSAASDRVPPAAPVVLDRFERAFGVGSE